MGKKFSVRWLDDKIVQVVVDGVEYKRIGQIPDEQDRDRLRDLMARASGCETEASAGDDAFTKIIFRVFLGVSALMWVIFAISAVIAGRSLAAEERTVGVILEMVVRKDEVGNDFYYPRVEFTLPGGVTRRIQLAEGSFPPAYYAGQQVKIAYDPLHPDDARIQTTGSAFARWIVSLVTGILGLAFALAAAFAQWMGKQPVETVMD